LRVIIWILALHTAVVRNDLVFFSVVLATHFA
jgi:hypothetical protein